MKKTLVLLVLNGIILSLVLIFVISCNLFGGGGVNGIGTIPIIGNGGSGGSGGTGGSDGSGGSGGTGIVGKVSNTFGTLLGRDIDSDGDNDAAVIFSKIVGGNNGDIGISIYTDSNCKIYVAGHGSNWSSICGYVLRLNTDGSVDNTFGMPLGRDINGDGINDSAVILDNIAGGNGYDYVRAFYLDSNNKVYIAGESSMGNGNYAMYVIRLNSDGSIDNNYGMSLGRDIDGDGNNDSAVLIYDSSAGGYGFFRYVSSFLVGDSNGKIYVTGTYTLRLNTNGSIDNTFGMPLGRDINGDGINDSAVIGGSSLCLDSTGKIYITGRIENGNNYDIYVIRLNNNGKVDNTFGSSLGRDIDLDGVNDSGFIINNISGTRVSSSDSIALDSTGKVVITGRSFNGRNYEMYVLKLNPDGSIDIGFGNNGVVFGITGGNGFDSRSAMVLDNFDKIYLTGQDINSDVYLIRLNSNGSLDTTFGNNGKVLVNNIIGSYDRGNSLCLDNQGKIYVTGDSDNVGNWEMYVLQIE